MNKKIIIMTLIFLTACTSAIPETTATLLPTETLVPNSATQTSLSNLTSNGPEVFIPTGASPIIDGQLSLGEWDMAETVELSNNGVLAFIYADNAIYVAIDADVLGIVNVGILRNDELWILHSSAALGSAIYQSQDDGWKMIKTFDWCCRSTPNASEYEQLFSTEEWLSTNQYQGNQYQTEYKILIPSDGIFISVTYLYRDGSGAAFWPKTLEEIDLLRFNSQPQVGDIAVFSSDQWAKLIVSD